MKNSKNSLQNLILKLQPLQPEETERARDSDLLNSITKKIGKRLSLWTKRTYLIDQLPLNHPLDTEERMQLKLNQEEEITEITEIEETTEITEITETEGITEIAEIEETTEITEEVPQEETQPEEAKAQPRDLHLEITAPTITIMIEDLKELKEETNSLSTLRTCLLKWMKLI